MSAVKRAEGRIDVFIDGEKVSCRPGTNLIDLVAGMGKEIPHYCYHPKLSVSGNCRMCLVELGTPAFDRATGKPVPDEKGDPKIMFFPNPVIACATRLTAGMHVKTQSDKVKECREAVLEFLLINHPLDCPICDQAGECLLQEFATDYGRGSSRFIEDKVVKPKRTVLGPRVMLDDERCILCSRCIRFCQEVVEDDVLGFVDQGPFTTLTCYPGKQLENNYSLNTVDICPVGALTSRDFRFRMRVWFLKETPSICAESSVGVNTLVASREGKVYRITPRRNDEVNDTWMSDSGRALYKGIEAGNRLLRSRINRLPNRPEQVLLEAARRLQGGKTAFVGSGQNSVEEQFLFHRLSRAARSVLNCLVSRTREGDGFLISNDANPNVRGALCVGFIDTLPEANLTGLAVKIDRGEVDTLVVCNEDLTTAGIGPSRLEKVQVIYLGTHGNATSEDASVVIPTLTVFEKSGTFINQQFRLQKFLQAVPGPPGVADDLVTISRLLDLLGGDEGRLTTPERVWTVLSSELKCFEGIAFDTLPETGEFLDGTAFRGLPFCEGATLHFEPETAAVEAGA